MADVDESTLSENEILTQIRDFEEKQLKVAKRTSNLLLAMTVIILVAVVIMVPAMLKTMSKVSTTVDKANSSLDEITTTVQKAQTTLEGIDEMSQNASLAASNMNQFIEENSESLTESIKAMSEVDFEGLDQAIEDLQTAVGPLAEMAKIIGGK